MKALFWVGLVVIALGLASLIVPIPHNDKEGISAGDLSVGINVRHDEKVSPIVSAAMIIAGVGLMIAGNAKK
jgi:hypothetical protein